MCMLCLQLLIQMSLAAGDLGLGVWIVPNPILVRSRESETDLDIYPRERTPNSLPLPQNRYRTPSRANETSDRETRFTKGLGGAGDVW